MEFVDTHCHIDLDAFDQDRAELIDRARGVGVRRFIVIGFEPERWQSALELAGQQPGVSVALGLHPTEAAGYSDALEANLRAAARNPSVVAIGETGIDYHWETAPPEVQRSAFERQIRLAKSLGLPFVVHQRKAAQDVLDVLRRTDPPHVGVMHCFTEDLEFANACFELGMHIGLGGVVTFRNARAVHEVAKCAPIDRLVLETDSPYMAPAPHRGKRNEPAYVRLIAERVAALRRMPVDAVAAATTANAEQLFRLDYVKE